jgi:hypothetical protein
MSHSRKPTFKYEIEYLIRPYGKKSPMIKREYEYALNKKDADEWVKTLKKNKDFVNIVEVRKGLFKSKD